MSTRKIELGYSEIQKKKRRIETQIASQKGDIYKFIKIYKKNELENTSWYSLNEQDNNHINIGENNNRERGIFSDEDNISNFTLSYFDREKFLITKDNKKTYLRSTMSQEKSNEFVLLSIKKEC